MIDLTKGQSETMRQYICRIGTAKDNGELDMTWDDLAQVMNEQTGENFSEGTYRQKWVEGKKWLEEVYSKLTPDSYLDEIRSAQESLAKTKMQVQDQRREYNSALRVDARFDHILETIKECAERLNVEHPLEFQMLGNRNDRGREAVLVFADLHYGLECDNIWSSFNVEICKDRIRQTVEETVEAILLHGVKKLYVVALGDLIHGAIHVSCRVASEEDTVDQLMHVSEALAEAIAQLAKYVPEVEVYSTYGNHARTIQNKKESVHSDNLEKIFPWFLKWRLADFSNVKILESEYYEFISLEPCGYNVVCSHGDLDKFKDFGTTVNTIFTKKFGKTVDYTITADKHHLEEFEKLGIESTLTRSLCGTDEYANGNRLYSIPGQTLMIFAHGKGKECVYPIRFE